MSGTRICLSPGPALLRSRSCPALPSPLHRVRRATSPCASLRRRLRLQSSAPGTWDTDAATPAWVLGAATTLDGALLNDPATMAVNFAVPDGGSFQLFAADFAGIEFAIGVTLRLTATFSDGTTATAVTVATAIVPTNPPSLTLTYNGLLQDRVAPSSLGVAPDGALDGTLTATLSAPGGRTI